MPKLEGVTPFSPSYNRQGSRGSERGRDSPKSAERGSGTTRARRPASWLSAHRLSCRPLEEPSLCDYRCVADPAQGQVMGGSQTRCRITPPLRCCLSSQPSDLSLSPSPRVLLALPETGGRCFPEFLVAKTWLNAQPSTWPVLWPYKRFQRTCVGLPVPNRDTVWYWEPNWHLLAALSPLPYPLLLVPQAQSFLLVLSGHQACPMPQTLSTRAPPQSAKQPSHTHAVPQQWGTLLPPCGTSRQEGGWGGRDEGE